MADEKEDRVKAAMTGGSKKKKAKKSASKPKSKSKKPSEVHIRKASDGQRYIIRHSHDTGPGEMPQKDTEHVANDMDELQAHIGEHMSPDEEPGTTPGGGAPGGSPGPDAGGGMPGGMQ
jgi:hypothetical protein